MEQNTKKTNAATNTDNSVSFENIKKILAIILGVSCLGWLIATYALFHRQGLYANGLLEKSFCHVNEFIDCDSVAFSKYSAFLKFPTAAWGMLFYAITILLTLLAYFSAQDRKAEKIAGHSRLVIFLCISGLVPTLALALLSLLKLGTLCIICLGTYIVNFILGFFALKLSSALATNNETSKEAASSNLKAAIATLEAPFYWMSVLVLALHLFSPAMVTNLVSKSTMDSTMINQIVASFKTSTPYVFSTTNAPSRGPELAPITVVEFSDFQCPYCALSARTMPTFLKPYEAQVRYVYKFYPLDSSCNPKMERSAHPLACKAAKIGYCVFKTKGSEAFFKYKEVTFAKQQEMSPESLMKQATDSGAVEADIKTCVEDPATHQYIVDNVNEGAAAKVEGTPSLYVNGRKVESGPNPEVLSRVFDEVLKSLSPGN